MYRVAAFAIIIGVLFSLFQAHVRELLYRNVAYISIVGHLAHNEPAKMDGQQPITLAVQAADYLNLNDNNSNLDQLLTKPCPMSSSIAIAEWYLRTEQFGKAREWMRYATSTIVDSQNPYIFPTWVSLTSDADIVLEWAERRWALRGDSNAVDYSITTGNDVRILNFTNTLGQKDIFIYVWLGRDFPLPLTCWHSLEMQVQVKEGTWFTLETRGTDIIQRQVNYHWGNGEWQTFVVPLVGDNLTTIYAIMNEHNRNSQTPDYELKLSTPILRKGS